MTNANKQLKATTSYYRICISTVPPKGLKSKTALSAYTVTGKFFLSCLADTFFICAPLTTNVKGSKKSSLSKPNKGVTYRRFFFCFTSSCTASRSFT